MEFADGTLWSRLDLIRLSLTGKSSNDLLTGTDLNDTLVGLGGEDSLLGGFGNDVLDGGIGDDLQAGEEGSDTLIGDASDTLTGGAGSDQFVVNSVGVHITDFNPAEDRIVVNVNGYNLPGEDAAYGSNGVVVEYQDGVFALPYWIDALIFDQATRIANDVVNNGFAYFGFPDQQIARLQDDALFTPTPESHRQFIRQFFSSLELLINVKFVESTDSMVLDDHRTIIFSNASFSTGGIADAGEGRVRINNGGVIDGLNTTADPRKVPDLVYVHEIGHILGLKHPFAERVAPRPILPVEEEISTWTVMSYYADPLRFSARQRFSPLDRSALDYLYGPSSKLSPEDSSIGLSATAANFIFDGAGVDTLDATGIGSSLTLSLEPGQRGHFGPVSNLVTSPGQVVIGFGSRIENAIGGNESDRLLGNDLNNAIYGMNGNDTLSGGRGHDTLHGGLGVDTAVFLGHRSGYQMIQEGPTQWLLKSLAAPNSDTIQVIDVERLEFADQVLDLSPASNTLPIPPGGVKEVVVRSLMSAAAIDLQPQGHTSASHLLIAGTAEAGQRVTVYLDGGVAGSTVVNSDRQWTVQIAGFNGQESAQTLSIRTSLWTGELGPVFEWGQINLLKLLPISTRQSEEPLILSGEAFNEAILGTDGIDFIFGYGGNDLIVGGQGNDILNGDMGYGTNAIPVYQRDGSVVFVSPTGNDTLEGGPGNDTLHGGAGNDVYVFGIGDGRDTILDATQWFPTPNGTLKFKVGISPDMVRAGQILDGYDIEVLLNSADRVVIRHFLGGQLPNGGAGISVDNLGNPIRWIEFADGTRWDRDSILQKVRQGIPPPLALTGTDQDDRLIGDFNDDRLESGAGADTLQGNLGNDSLVGGPGVDVARYLKLRSEYALTRRGDGGLSVSGPEGTDDLVGIERLAFSDVALGFDDQGTGGLAFRLYKAAYDRLPDPCGLGFWLYHLDRGFNQLEAANNFLNSEEFRMLYDDNANQAGFQEPSTERFVSKLYRHVLQREPEGAGYQFWVDAMNNKDGAFGKKFSRGEVLLAFAESKENQANLIGVIQAGFEYTPFDPAGG